jgi:toxin-antitoxin system PIN domain toxin
LFVIDTNILLHAVNPDSRDHKKALAALERWRAQSQPWFVTWGIIYEFLRVATHRQVFPKPLDLTTAEAWIRTLLTSRSGGILAETDRHAELLSQTAAAHARLAGNPVHDLHTAVLMKEHGVSQIRTADTDFHQFPFLDVVSPLA